MASRRRPMRRGPIGNLAGLPGGAGSRRALGVVLMAPALSLGACGLLTGPVDGEIADLRGTWTLTGTQNSPSLQLAGTLTISRQTDGEIIGTATWEERDGAGGVRIDGGAVNGLVLTAEDVDFDITLVSGERRLIGRLVADTLSGAWAQPSVSANGAFRAVRRGTP